MMEFIGDCIYSLGEWLAVIFANPWHSLSLLLAGVLIGMWIV